MGLPPFFYPGNSSTVNEASYDSRRAQDKLIRSSRAHAKKCSNHVRQDEAFCRIFVRTLLHIRDRGNVELYSLLTTAMLTI